jgi:putative flippase GtrA
MYDQRAMSSHGQVRVAGQPWGWSLLRNAIVLRADNVAAQGMRYACTGVVVSVVYITITTLLSAVVHVRFELALVIGWCGAISVHFTLQRTFVWAREARFALPFRHQVGRYLLIAVSQLGITAATTTVLPSLLGISAELVYLATGGCITVVNFLVFRKGVFHASGEAGLSSASAAPAVPPRSP